MRLITLKWRLIATAVVVAVVLGFALILGGGSLGSSSDSGTAGCGTVGLGAAPGTIAWPLKAGSYVISSPYGPRAGGFHHGVDLAAPLQTPIYAAADGLIERSGAASGFGDWIVEKSTINGAVVGFVYGHEYDTGLVAREGEQVTTGQLIGYVGANGEATGPHLHFEVWLGGRLSGGHDVDPLPWLNANAGSSTITQPVSQPLPTTPPAPSSPAGTGSLVGPFPPQGQQATMSIDAEQRGNVDKIVATVKGQGQPLRVAVIAVATTMQESGIREIAYGDAAGPDSRGLYQQRAPWGPLPARMDPVQSTVYFLKGGAGGQAGLLVHDWAHLPLETVVVQTQVSVGGYAKWELQAEQLVAASAGVDPITAGIGTGLCTLG